MNLIIPFLLWTFGIVALVMAIDIFRHSDLSKNENRSLIWMAFSTIFWCDGYGIMTVFTNNYTYAYIARAVGLFGVYMFLPAIVHFIASIVKVNRKTVITLFSIAIIASLYVVYLVSKPSVVTFEITKWGLAYRSLPSSNRFIQSIYTFTLLIASLYCLITLIRTTKKKREKLNYICYIIAVLCLFAGMTLDTLLPTFGYISFPGSPMGAMTCLSVLYYLAKYRNAFVVSKVNIAEYLYKFISTPICVANGDNIIELFTEDISKYIDIPASELKYKNWLEVFNNGPEFLEQVNSIMKKTDDIDTYGTLEFQWESVNHKKFKVNVNVVYDVYGDSVCTILLFTDVTTYYELYNELEISREKALEASRAKSNFLANMSHEIRTPMNTILGMNEMILRESENENVRKYANDVATSGDALLSIINDILDFSKIESGKLDIIPVKYDFAKLVRNIYTLLIKRVSDKCLEFKYDIDPNIPVELIGDDVRIQQIIINLTTNAIKYTQTGYVKLTARWDAAKNSLRVAVEDSGIGIKEEDIPKLYQAFQRIEEERNRTIEGTGLGLSITTQLLLKMDSQLEVSSEYGKGSCFSFEIIQEVSDATPIGNYETYIRNKEKSLQKHSGKLVAAGKKVLVVDDNKMNLVVFGGLLKGSEINVTMAQSGAECLEKVANEHFDIIFMDHMMPEMDGIETFHKLRAGDSVCKDVPVIALTANAIAGAEQLYLNEGFDSYLPKPIKPADLEACIKNILKIEE